MTVSLFILNQYENQFPVPTVAPGAAGSTATTGASLGICPGVPGRSNWWFMPANSSVTMLNACGVFSPNLFLMCWGVTLDRPNGCARYSLSLPFPVALKQQPESASSLAMSSAPTPSSDTSDESKSLHQCPKFLVWTSLPSAGAAPMAPSWLIWSAANQWTF